MENNLNFNKQFPTEVSEKSSLITLVLALFLGGLGIHRFYIGKTKTAIVILLMTLLILFYRFIFISLIYEDTPEWIVPFFIPSAYLIFGLQLLVGVWVLTDIVRIFLGKFKDREGKLIKGF